MAPKKIVIFGITGTQGGSVARALLEDGPEKFEVWGVTRNKSSKKSQALEKQGIKLIQGDLDDPSSYEAGLKGADNAWINADFWIYYKGNNADEAAEREVKQNKGAIEACRRQGVPQVTFSALQSFDGKVPHCDSKNTVAVWLKEIGYNHALVYANWYFSNVELFGKKKQGDKWVVEWPFPDDFPMIGFAAEQIGEWARLVFRDPAKWNGKSIHCDADFITPADQAKALTDAVGVTVVPSGMTREKFYSDDFKKSMPEELWRNYQAILDGGMKHDVKLAHELNPNAWYFKDWAKNTPSLKEQFAK